MHRLPAPHATLSGTATSVVAALCLASAGGAQVTGIRPVTPPVAAPSLRALEAHQAGFESFRRQNLPVWRSRRPEPNRCDERVGRFCYWYDESEQEPPPEPASIREARERLIVQLDSAGRAFPSNRWVSGQRIRYLAEAKRYDDAIAAARACTIVDWWCHALQGFAFHVAGRYADADSAYERALALMDERERCEWRDLKLMLDDALLRRYRELGCRGRSPLEQRVWWLARPMLSERGNDARTEYYSRLMMTEFIEDAASAYQMGFDTDERELVLRYGWPYAWTREPSSGILGGPAGGVVGHEHTPSHPVFPAPGVLENPASSDSAGWRSKGIPPVRARYAPAYARRLLPLEHQAGLFRRGDTAVVAVAWSVATDTALAAAAHVPGELSAALVLTKGEESDATIVRSPRPGIQGTLVARSPWGSMLMSVEVAARARRTLARARYGVHGSDAPQSRVQVSDVVLFEAGDSLPSTLDEVLPLMRSSERIPAGSRIGLFWESYNTRATGEGLGVSITVAPEGAGGGWLQRGLRALRRVREAAPVTIGMRDVSARGQGYTPRAVVVDLSTLVPGRYLMQLEIDAGEGNLVRTARAITVVSSER